MSGRWIKKNRARSEWGRKLAKKRWAKHRASVDEKIRNGEVPADPPPWPLDKSLFEITVKLNRTGTTHQFELFRSKTGRIDQYRIPQNGQEWKMAMGLARFLRGLGAALFGARAEVVASRKA